MERQFMAYQSESGPMSPMPLGALSFVIVRFPYLDIRRGPAGSLQSFDLGKSPIRPITGRHSLFPASYARWVISHSLRSGYSGVPENSSGLLC